MNNTATGVETLVRNTTGSSNTALGYFALINNTTGNNNIAVGEHAGSNLTTGSNNIDIGNLGCCWRVQNNPHRHPGNSEQQPLSPASVGQLWPEA